MISIEDVTLEFSGKALFSNISFLIQPKDKIGLVGNNGAGKTTLLKILLGTVSPTEGRTNIARDLRMGYLPQELNIESKETVYNYVFKQLTEISSLKDEIESLNNEISEREDFSSESYEKLVSEFSEKTERYNFLGGDSIEGDIERTLKGLGFEQDELSQPLEKFSGGWRMRVELAKILLQRPDVILLDEPTNHLDIESIQWLEDYLKGFQGAIVLISHDRRFLDQVTERTLELSMGNLYDYKMPYSEFVKEKEKRIELQKSAYYNQQKKIKEDERFIDRFRYKASKASVVQSRIKQLEKMDKVEWEDEDHSRIDIRFPEAPRSGREVVRTRHLSKSFGSHLVLNDLDFLLERGEKVAFVGQNGTGKTTLVRIIMDELEFEGEVTIGYNVEVGYYAQNQDETLDTDKTVLQTLEDIAGPEIRPKVRDILGAFLFKGEEVEKRVEVLSGGEKARLALAKMLLRPYNLLILDEPTNHLDMRSKDILKDALKNYNGSVIVVSHDRYFLNGLSDKIYEFRKKQIKEHHGDIFEFLQKKKIENLDALHVNKKTEKKEKQTKKQTKEQFEERKALNRKINKAEKEIKSAEKKIEELEAEITKMDEMLKEANQLEDHNFFRDYDQKKKELQHWMDKWEQLHIELEDMKQKLDS
jgi:ATP-binding cassette subfamily F protein 3